MTADCAVCYVTDINFLLPSLVSAASFRRFVSKEKAQVFVFLIDGEDDYIKEINIF